jgi:phospholipid transport system substrate-binding protein
VSLRSATAEPRHLGRRRFLQRLLPASLLGLAFAGDLARAAPGPAAAARAFIEDLGTRAVAVLKDPTLDRRAKLDRLVPLLNEATDLPLVARLVLGRYWRQATPEQRETYTRLFVALVVKTMAERLTSYGGETFSIAAARPADQQDSVVSTVIVRPSGGDPLHVDWRVREHQGGFAVIDIVAEGISMVVTHRSEVNEIVARAGIDGLLATMRTRLIGPA